MREFVLAAGACGVSPDELFAGLPFGPADFEGVLRRIPWRDCVAVFERAAAKLGSDASLEELGRRSVGISSSWAFQRLVPHLVTPTRLLRIAWGFAGPATFPHVNHKVEDLEGGAMRLTLTLPPPYEESESYFRMCVGGVRSLPTLFGYRPAHVAVVAIGPRGLTLDVTPPPSLTIAGRVRHALGALRGESVLFEEATRQHEALQKMFGELLRTQNELHEFMESIPDTIVVHRDGVIAWGNRALLTALRCASLDDLRGKRIVDFVHPAERSAAGERIAASVGDALAGTYRVRAMDGSFRTFEVSKPQLVTFEGSPARMTVARDVTERDAFRQQLVLADRMTQLGFLAAGVAHEINNPLAYALTALDVASRDLAAGRSDSVGEALALAREGAERVRAITRDLHLFSRGGEERRESVDVARVLRATVSLAAANVRAHGRLTSAIGPLPNVLGDEARVGQVFMNLLVNALDAIKDRDPLVSHIQVRAHADADGRVVVEVEDNGCGIPDDVLPRIFDPFFTTKAPRSGSGLGLAICQRIVSDLGGRIEALSPAASDPGGAGALFRVTLPSHASHASHGSYAAHAAHAAHAAESVAPARPAECPRRSRLRVLVVDDEPPLARAVGQMLAEQHDVDVVTSGEEALGRLGEGAAYDAILCDLMMAGLSGVDLYERLQAQQSCMGAKMVFMTGGAFSTRAQRFLTEVKNECLEKPFTADSVLDALEAVHARSR
jgi:PAS domain S-box-containing protein